MPADPDPRTLVAGLLTELAKLYEKGSSRAPRALERARRFVGAIAEANPEDAKLAKAAKILRELDGGDPKAVLAAIKPN